jgi:hypothetical protein
MDAITEFLVGFFSVFGLTFIFVWLFSLVRRQHNRGAASGRPPRLKVIDTTAVDEHRCLVLVRRDNIDHLVMIGGPSDVVIERRAAATDRPPIPERRVKTGAAGQTLDPQRPAPSEAPATGPAEPMLPLYPPAASTDALAPPLAPGPRAARHSDLADLAQRFEPLFDTIMRSLHEPPPIEMGESENLFARQDQRAERRMAPEDVGSESETKPPSPKTT